MEKNKNKKDNKEISIFDLNYDVIEELNEINTANTFQGDNILGNLKNETTYKDDSEVLFQSSTFKINKLNPNTFKMRNSVLLPEQNKLISLINFRKEYDFIKNSKKRKENKNSTIKYITYEDTFLENEVFIPSPASYAGESLENNKLLNDFCEDYNYDNYNNDIMNNSFSFKTKNKEGVRPRIFDYEIKQQKEKKNNKFNIRNLSSQKQLRSKNIINNEKKNENLITMNQEEYKIKKSFTKSLKIPHIKSTPSGLDGIPLLHKDYGKMPEYLEQMDKNSIISRIKGFFSFVNITANKQ